MKQRIKIMVIKEIFTRFVKIGAVVALSGCSVRADFNREIPRQTAIGSLPNICTELTHTSSGKGVPQLKPRKC